MFDLNHVKKISKRFIYRRKFRTTHRDWNTWVFGEWFGVKCNDSCCMLANYVADNCSHINVYWIARTNCKGLSRLSRNITVLEMNSDESISILKKAGVVFVNEGLQDLSEDGYNYSSGSIIVNLWHGVPWKKIGMDSYRDNQHYAKIYARTIFKLQDFSYFPSPSDKCSRSLTSGFMLKPDNIIKSGLPRNALFFDNEKIAAIRKDVIASIPSGELKIDGNTKIISYLPTFRDGVQNVFDFGNIKDKDKLNAVLSKYNAIIVQKSHIANQMRQDAFEKTNIDRIVTWNDCSAQELMGASDILITDYSSCFFDFLILDRPIIHYIYDYEYYSSLDRGLYYKKEDVVCGDAVMGEDGLIESIINNLNNPCKDAKLRESRRRQYLTYEGPDSCRIITECIINRIKSKKGS